MISQAINASIKTAPKKIWTISNLIFVTAFGTAGLLILLFILKQTNVNSLIQSYKNSGLFILIILILQNLTFLLPIFWLKSREQVYLREFGFNKVGFKKIIGYTFLGFLIFFGINVIVKLIELFYNIRIPGFGEQEDRISLFGFGFINQIISFLSIVFLAPLMEEFIFRGFLYKTLKNYLPFSAAVIFGGLIFALSHLEFNVLIPLWILGSILCYLYGKTNSIITPIIFHIANNALAFALETYFISNGN